MGIMARMFVTLQLVSAFSCRDDAIRWGLFRNGIIRPAPRPRENSGSADRRIFSPEPARVCAYQRVARATLSGISLAATPDIPPRTMENTASHTASCPPRTTHRQRFYSAGHAMSSVWSWAARQMTGAELPVRGSRSYAHVQKYSIFLAADSAWMRRWLPENSKPARPVVAWGGAPSYQRSSIAALRFVSGPVTADTEVTHEGCRLREG